MSACTGDDCLSLCQALHGAPGPLGEEAGPIPGGRLLHSQQSGAAMQMQSLQLQSK
jgi:hypothetical protein